MTSIGISTKRTLSLNKAAYFSYTSLVLGFIGFIYAGAVQDFYASSLAFQFACVVGIVLSLPSLILTLRNTQIRVGAKSKLKLLGAYLVTVIMILFVFTFFTYWWLPRSIHFFIGETATHTYFVISKNELPTFRGCNTHYWVRLSEWQDRTRENVCVTEAKWKTLKLNSYVSVIETVSLFGATVHVIQNDNG